MRALELRPLELACGLPIGADAAVADLAAGGGAGGPRDAMASELTPLLARTPCLVSFSGGRDSSAVLAVATWTARREGLPDPVPVTLRFPGVATTQESGWQELVVAHLGLRDWQRIELDGELDLLGDVACAALRTHGLLWPANAYFHVPMFELAAGGALLTGFDGDGLFADWRWARAQAVLHGRTLPRPRDAARVALALAPYRVRRTYFRRRPPLLPAVPWVREAARARIAAIAARQAALEPRRFDRRLSWYVRRRYLRLTLHSLEALAGARGVRVACPLLGPAFLGALARRGGPAGLGERSAAVRSLFGDLLPEGLLARRGKAEFGRALWRERAQAFARDWDGRGLDLQAIDEQALREAWRAPSPLFGASTLLHAAWLFAEEAAAAGAGQAK